MSYTETRYRYRYIAEIPEKARPRRVLRERGAKRAATEDLQKALFDWLDRPTAGPWAAEWVQFAYRLARHDMARDPDGDYWMVRRRWEAIP